MTGVTVDLIRVKKRVTISRKVEFSKIVNFHYFPQNGFLVSGSPDFDEPGF